MNIVNPKKPIAAPEHPATRQRRCFIAALLSLSALLLTAAPSHATSSDDLDIGAPTIAGGSSFSAGVYTISGCGTDIWNQADQFHFNKGTLTGSGTVTARVTGIGNTNSWAKGGVMLRNNSTSGATFADVVVSPSSGLAFQWRTIAGGSCSSTQISGLKAPIWVKVSRTGSSVNGFYGTDGVHWTQIGAAHTVPLGTVALAGIAVTSHNASALSTSTFTNFAVTPAADGRYLHTQSNEIRNAAGQLVTLRGTNIGGWLVTEGWMCGQTDSGGRFALEQLEARFGTAQASTLINAWRDNWFTDRDMDNIQNYGFTLIRVPFSWRNLQDAQGNWSRDAQGNIDFSRFDWVVQEAAKRGLYVIFDFHVWPGQQLSYGNICQAGEPGNTQRTQSAAIWSALATHFQGNGTIAAFDLINEPTGSNDYYDAHRAFYAAIRAADPNRMLVAEWVNTADFSGLGWTNTMCSGHYPAGNKADLSTFAANLSTHTEYSTLFPCYVGECKSDDSSNVTQNAAEMTQGFNHLGWAWTTWTYKAVNNGGWALFDYDGSMSYNLATDSDSSILSKWTATLSQWQNPANPVNYYLKTDILAGLQQGAAAINPPLVSGRSYELVNFNSGRVLDSWGGSQGTQPNQYQGTTSPYNNSNDHWLAAQLSDGNWTFANSGGLILDDSGVGTTNGTAVIQWPITGGVDQEWALVPVGDGTYKLVNAYSGLDMEVAGASQNQGAAIDQWADVPGAPNEHWTFAPLN